YFSGGGHLGIDLRDARLGAQNAVTYALKLANQPNLICGTRVFLPKWATAQGKRLEHGKARAISIFSWRGHVAHDIYWWILQDLDSAVRLLEQAHPLLQ